MSWPARSGSLGLWRTLRQSPSCSPTWWALLPCPPRLTPEIAEELRQTHFGLLRTAVSAAGGTEVKNLGDGLMVAFSSLIRALACAVAIQHAVERHNRRTAQPMAIRVGLSHGEATEDDGDFFGEPVIEAARLCAHAEGGQILTSAVARALAGRHATQEFVAIGEVELKGLPDPVEVVEVRWAPDSRSRPGRHPTPAAELSCRYLSREAVRLLRAHGRAEGARGRPQEEHR